MPFVHEPITPADQERMDSLNILIGWKKPNARSWTINRETGDFLVRIGRDMDFPHWTQLGFWWNGKLFRVETSDIKTHPDTGYCLEVMRVGAEDGKPIPVQYHANLEADLFDAVKVDTTASVNSLFAEIPQTGQVPKQPSNKHSIELICTLYGLKVSPFATFHADFPRSF